MTNKLPVVGKRYKRLHCGNEYELISFCQNRNSYFLKAITGIDKDAVFEFSNYFAEKHFVEIKPETQNSELSPEVKEAMEKLRKELLRPIEADLEQSDLTIYRKAYFTSQKAAHALISALDKQFKVNEVEEECELETAADKWNSTELKEESIWRSVKCLDGNEIIPRGFVRKGEEYEASLSTKRMTVDEWEGVIEEFCSIDDFLNDYEKLKERVRKLESK